MNQAIIGDGGDDAAIRIESTNSSGAGFMYMQRNTDGKSYVLNGSNQALILGADNNTSQLYLKENGNVGIGTTSPLSALHVKTTTQFQGIFLDDESGLIAKIARGDATGDPYFNMYSNNGVNATAKVSIQANESSYFNGGNIGIGTTTPTHLLTLQRTSDSGFEGVNFKNSTGESRAIIMTNPSDNGYMQLHDNSNTYNEVLIHSSGDSYFNGGNVGIGTVSPAQLLHVKAASGDAKVLINANGEGDEAHLMLRTGGINKTAIVASGISNWGRTDLRFILNSYTNANNYGLSDTKMIIKNDGKVGIGTNSPTEKLDVAGNIKFNGALMPNNNAGSSGQVLTSSGTGVPTWTTISGGATTLAALTDVITTGQSSILIGGGSSSANYNTAFGYSSLDATSSEKNAAFGHNSLTNSTSGGSNSGFGQDSGKNIITGSFNTVLGRKSGFDISSGEYNVMLGFNAGDNITTNSQNTFIGSNTVGGNTTNASVLGYGITSQGSNTVTLGNTDITDIYMAQDSGATIHAADLNLGGTAVTATATEINYLDGVTSNVQTQIDALGSGATTYNVGDIAQGGKVFWVDATGQHGLVVALEDAGGSSVMDWNAGTASNGLNLETLAQGSGIYAGKMNTAIIIAVHASAANNGNNFAARVCNEYNYNQNGVDYGDWYLPSKDELHLIKTSGVGPPNLYSYNYWSSTEYDANNAYSEVLGNYANNYNQYKPKDTAEGVKARAIRAF